jgi:hypothetical protein
MLRYGTGAVRRIFDASSECGSRQHGRADQTPLTGGSKTRSTRPRSRRCGRRPPRARSRKPAPGTTAPRAPNPVSATILILFANAWPWFERAILSPLTWRRRSRHLFLHEDAAFQRAAWTALGYAAKNLSQKLPPHPEERPRGASRRMGRATPEAPSCFETGPSDPPQQSGLGSVQRLSQALNPSHLRVSGGKTKTPWRGNSSTTCRA